MKIPHFKFTWGRYPQIQGALYLGLFGWYARREGGTAKSIAISVRGVLIWLVALVIAGYLAGTTALWWVWQKNPYNLLTYEDAVMYPVRKKERLEKRGQAFETEGIDRMHRKEWSAGYTLLQQGLGMYPNNLPARLELARFNMAIRQRPIAAKIMADGLTDTYPGRVYAQTLFEIATSGEDYDLIVKTANRYLPLLKGDPTAIRDRRWLLSQDFNALLASGRNEEALALADAEGPNDVTNENKALALIQAGKPGEAAKFLEQWRTQPGADVRTALRLQVRAYREAGRLDDMLKALEEFRGLAAGQPAPYVYAVVQESMAGMDERARVSLDEYLFRYGSVPANLMLVGEPLSDIANVPLLEHCIESAKEHGFGLRALLQLLVRAHITRGEWVEANAILTKMPPAQANTAVYAQERALDEWMRKVIAACLAPAEAAQLELTVFMRSQPWPMALFRPTILALRKAGRNETAMQVIATAEGAFPNGPWMATQHGEVQAALTKKAETIAAAAAATEAAKPVARRTFAEQTFFEQLNPLVTAAKWTEVDSLIHELRAVRPLPGWVSRRDADIQLAAMRSAYGQGDGPATGAAADLAMNSGMDRAKGVLDFANEIYARGDRETATLLVQRIQRKYSDYEPARRTLAEWKDKEAKEREAKGKKE